MARIVLVKLLSGLNLGVRQLSGQLQRAGHEALVVFFKRGVAGPVALESEYQVADYPALTMFTKGELWNWNLFKPVTDGERALLLQEIQAFGADLVGFSLPSMCMSMAADLTAYLHRHASFPIVWGGPGPTLEPDVAISHADLVCINEGEEVLVELAERLDRKEDLTDIPGTWARRPDGAVVKNPKRPLLDLESIAIPTLDREKMIEIDSDRVHRNYSPYALFRHYDIMTQRGCPFSCSFCVESKYQEMFGKSGSLRRRSVDVVIEELVAAKEKMKINAVMFWDDVFTVNPRWLREFAPRYAKEVRIPFWCYTYPTTTRKEDIRLLRDAGCISMTMGIQSGSQRILNEYFNRPTPLDRALEAAEIIMDEGILLYFDLISKVVWETEQDLKDTFEFLLRLPPGIKMSGVGYMRSYPGYSYTEQIAAAKQDFQVDDETYDFYHRLYFLALADLPVSLKRAIASDPFYRKNSDLLGTVLPQKLDWSYISNDDAVALQLKRRSRKTVDLGIAQADIAEEARTKPVSSVRRLPLLTP